MMFKVMSAVALALAANATETDTAADTEFLRTNKAFVPIDQSLKKFSGSERPEKKRYEPRRQPTLKEQEKKKPYVVKDFSGLGSFDLPERGPATTPRRRE